MLNKSGMKEVVAEVVVVVVVKGLSDVVGWR